MVVVVVVMYSIELRGNKTTRKNWLTWPNREKTWFVTMKKTKKRLWFSVIELKFAI